MTLLQRGRPGSTVVGHLTGRHIVGQPRTRRIAAAASRPRPRGQLHQARPHRPPPLAQSGGRPHPGAGPSLVPAPTPGVAAVETAINSVVGNPLVQTGLSAVGSLFGDPALGGQIATGVQVGEAAVNAVADLLGLGGPSYSEQLAAANAAAANPVWAQAGYTGPAPIEVDRLSATPQAQTRHAGIRTILAT